MRVEETQIGQYRCQYDEEHDNAGHGRVLQFEHVSLIQTFEFVVLESMPIENPRHRERTLRIHGLYAVVHANEIKPT